MLAERPPYPARVVCLTEETTKTLYRIGAGDLVVGASGFTVRPPEAAQASALPRRPRVFFEEWPDPLTRASAGSRSSSSWPAGPTSAPRAVPRTPPRAGSRILGTPACGERLDGGVGGVMRLSS